MLSFYLLFDPYVLLPAIRSPSLCVASAKATAEGPVGYDGPDI